MCACDMEVENHFLLKTEFPGTIYTFFAKKHHFKVKIKKFMEFITLPSPPPKCLCRQRFLDTFPDNFHYKSNFSQNDNF